MSPTTPQTTFERHGSGVPILLTCDRRSRRPAHAFVRFCDGASA
jgi:hypothetical protein